MKQTPAFSQPFDLIVFALIPVLGFLLGFIDSGWMTSKNAVIVFLYLFVDIGHIYLSIIPASKISVDSKRMRFIFVIIAIFVIALFTLSYVHFFRTTVEIFSYIALLHIIKQHRGMYTFQDKSQKTQKCDFYLYYSLVFVPVAIWHMDIIPKLNFFYFHKNDLFIRIPENFLIPLCLLQLGIFLYWFWIKFQRYSRNLISFSRFESRNLILHFGTAIWYWGCLIVQQSMDSFFLVLILVHGLTYYSSVYTSQTDNQSQLRRIITLLSIGTIGGAITILGKINFPTGTAIGGLMFGILFCHHVFDTFLWRRKFRQWLSQSFDTRSELLNQ